MTVVAPPEKYTPKDFTSDQEIRWCPGCGDYAIVKAVRATLAEIGTPPHETVFVSGIGCAARFPYYMATYGFHTIHGRAPALATGLKLANPKDRKSVVEGKRVSVRVDLCGSGHSKNKLKYHTMYQSCTNTT